MADNETEKEQGTEEVQASAPARLSDTLRDNLPDMEEEDVVDPAVAAVGDGVEEGDEGEGGEEAVQPTTPPFTEDDLNKLINSLVETREETKKVEQARAATAAELQEKIRAAESGDEDAAAEIGRLALENLKRIQQAEALRKEVAPVIRQQTLAALDEAVDAVYGPVIDSLSPEERAALDPSKFSSDGAFIGAVLKTLNEKQVSQVRAEYEGTVKEKDAVIASARTGARANSTGRVLPGGTASENQGTSSIGQLLREGLGDLDESD